MAGERHELTVEELKAPTENALATGPFGSAISSKHFLNSGVPVIRGSNLSEEVGTRLIDDGLVFVSPEKAKEFRRSIARSGDLIFTCWGTVNQVGLIDQRAKFSEYVISNKQMKFSPNPEIADSLFLYYFFSGPEIQESIKINAIGSSVPGFNLGQLRAMRLKVPHLTEQRAIAHILGTLDDKIELNRRMNTTLEAMARAIFKSWFVDFDPVRAKAEGRAPEGLAPEIAALFPERFEDSELGEIPAGWEVKPLPEAIKVNPSRSLRKGETAPYLDMANVPTNTARANQVIEREFGSGTKFKNGDTLLARITPCLENGKTAYVDFLEGGQIGWGSTEFIVLRPKPPLPPEFAYFLARDQDFRAFAIANMSGTSGRQRVPADCFNRYPLTVPPSEISAAFGRFASGVMCKIKGNDEQSRTLATLRDTLLPKLLSGELRVREAERQLEQAL